MAGHANGGKKGNEKGKKLIKKKHVYFFITTLEI